jgi:hydroxymethylglutaryl-CoA lyase
MSQIEIIEVGPRDGLQSVKKFISTQDKITWINLLSKCGYKTIQVTSFVPSTWMPQLADHYDVFTAIDKKPDVNYMVIINDLNNLEDALKAGVKEIAVFIGASESFSQKINNCAIAENLFLLAPIIAKAKAQQMKVRGCISCIVNCPYEGKVSVQHVVKLTQKLLDLGCDKITLADTTGKATPNEIRQLFKELTMIFDVSKLAGHFHDTDGCAIANIDVAFKEFGVSSFESALVDPVSNHSYVPGSKGNVITEKVIQYFLEQGIDPGINKAALIQAKQFIDSVLNKVYSEEE